jgi:hypothetical protein
MSGILQMASTYSIVCFLNGICISALALTPWPMKPRRQVPRRHHVEVQSPTSPPSLPTSLELCISD